MPAADAIRPGFVEGETLRRVRATPERLRTYAASKGSQGSWCRSRRVADARARLAATHADTTEQGQQFAAGFREAFTLLTSEKLHDLNERGAAPKELVDAALDAAVTKRASKADRDEWAAQVQFAQNAGSQRGYLVAAVVLVREDAAWGFRDNVHTTIHGGIDW